MATRKLIFLGTQMLCHQLLLVTLTTSSSERCHSARQLPEITNERKEMPLVTYANRGASNERLMGPSEKQRAKIGRK